MRTINLSLVSSHPKFTPSQISISPQVHSCNQVTGARVSFSPVQNRKLRGWPQKTFSGKLTRSAFVGLSEQLVYYFRSFDWSKLDYLGPKWFSPVRIGPRFSKFCWSWFGLGPWIPNFRVKNCIWYFRIFYPFENRLKKTFQISAD